MECYPESNSIIAGSGGSGNGGLGSSAKERVKPKQFTFHGVFGPDAQQAELYARVVEPLAASFLDGYNATIFAYGQTGSGKTFSMLGYDPEGGSEPPSVDMPSCGITPRLMAQLIAEVEERNRLAAEEGEGAMRLSVSYVEIYNEAIQDLLAPEDMARHSKSASSKLHDLVRDVHGNYVPRGVVEVEVTSMEDVARVLR